MSLTLCGLFAFAHQDFVYHNDENIIFKADLETSDFDLLKYRHDFPILCCVSFKKKFDCSLLFKCLFDRKISIVTRSAAGGGNVHSGCNKNM